VAKKEDENAKQKNNDASPKEQDDFSYIVRIANTDIDGDKTVLYGLTSIKGVGRHMSMLILNSIKLDKDLKMGNLTEKQIELINTAIENIKGNAPSWMLNHRKDYESGEDIHLIGSQIELQLRDEINIMKKIRSYKGIRHERGLPSRGQRTRSNNRKGLSLGVSRKDAKK
jgi:small subunit ribosomal protein S13